MSLGQSEQMYCFVQKVWPAISENQFRCTLKQYSRLSKKLERDLYTLSENLDTFALQSHEQILDLVQELRQMEDMTREEAMDCLYKLSPGCRTYDEETSLRTLRCAINVWLTISMGSSSPMRRTMEWGSGQTLTNVVASLIEESVTGEPPFASHQQQLPEDLTAASLVDHHGFCIQWTHDLSSHLSIDWKYKILTVYEHKIMAYNHMRYGASSLPVPDQLFEEVIDTLNLLFPFQDDATKKLLAKDDIAFHGLGLCGRPRKLLLNDYHYWRGQIGNVYQIAQSPAIGVQQLFLDEDGTNFVSTFNFWIAVAVSLLTVMGMAIAIVALVYSIKQYWLGLKQYELSVAQACVDSSVRQLVPHLCDG